MLLSVGEGIKHLTELFHRLETERDDTKADLTKQDTEHTQGSHSPL